MGKLRDFLEVVKSHLRRPNQMIRQDIGSATASANAYAQLMRGCTVRPR
jgi:hypothetical protein